MGRLLGRLLAAAGWTLLGALALTGVAISAVVGLAASTAGRPLVAGAVVRQLDEMIAGRLALEAVQVLPQGGIELRGVSVFSPEERQVLQVSRLRIFPDLTRLGLEEIGVVIELDGPSVVLEEDEDGGVSLARAFAPTTPSPPAPATPGETPGRPGWTFRLTRLTVRGGDLWWQRPDRSTAAEVTGIAVDAEGSYGPAGGFVGLDLRASASAPVEGPLALRVAAHLQGDRLDVPVLRAALGPTALEATGRADLDTLSFRAAVTRLAVGAATVRRLAPSAAPGEDLAGAAYAESDGALLTAALDVRPSAAEGRAPARGTARAAAAVRVKPAVRALGLDLAVEALDPSRLLAQAPPGRVTLSASGAVAGTALADLRGRLSLQLAPSRLRAGELGPVTLSARAERGLVEVARLDARLPGLSVEGSGRWREGGALGGELRGEAADLALAGRNLAALTGAPLPPLAGRVEVRATLTGTSAVPEARVTLIAAHLEAGEVRVDGAAISAEAAGPLEAPRLKLTGSVARAAVGAAEARGLQLAARFVDGEAALSFGGHLPALGNEPLSVEARAALAKDRRTAELRELGLGWHAIRWTLARPATLTFAPPRVDRLELVEGGRHLVLTGGVGEKGALDARLEAERLDLSRLPAGLLPAGLGLRGELSLDARLGGTTREPTLAAHLALAGGEARGLRGLQLLGDVGWDGRTRRLAADLGLLRAEGGALDLAVDVPLPLERAKGTEPLSLTADASGWSIEVLRGLAAVEVPVSGTVGAHLLLAGTVAAPTARGTLTLEDGRLEDLGPVGAAAALELIGDTAGLEVKARLGPAPLLDLEAHLPLDLAGLLLHPEAAARALPRAPLTGALDVPGLELSTLAGKLGLPEALAGTVRGRAALSGSLLAPRGQASLSVAGLEVAGHRDLSGRLELAAEAQRTALVVRVAAGEAEALRLDAALGAPPERLAEAAVRRAAPLSLTAAVPGLPLRLAAGRGLPLDGTLTVHLEAKGTLARPEGRLDVAGAGLVVNGRPLGDVAAVARYEAPTGTVELKLEPTAGGALWAGATVAAPFGLDLTGAALRRAPATLRVTSDRLDLGFLPSVAPGLVRAASGPLTVDLEAKGPLEALRPRGTVKLTGGRVAVVELGDWSDLELEAALGDRSLEVSRLEARRGKGRLSGRLAVHDLATARSTLSGRLDFERFTFSRAGMDVLNLELPLELSGTLTDELLDATVTIPGGTIRLPKKTPRALQPLEGRPDVQVGRPKPRARSWFEGPAEQDGPAGKPFEARCRVVIPGKVSVLGEKPDVDVEVKGDVTFRLVDGELLAEGPVEVVKGKVEPMSGRIFHVERGRLTFPGGSWKSGQLDVAARYDNPAAQVTVTIGGVVPAPTVKLTSRPPMDEAAIAMLIATGRTEIKANTSEVSSLSGKDAGAAAATAVMTMAFQGLVSDKLPVDQVSLDATMLRAGKYLTDRIFIGYTRRFDAKPEQGENENEVKAELQLTPRWNFELRYGDAQSGDASLIWTKDY